MYSSVISIVLNPSICSILLVPVTLILSIRRSIGLICKPFQWNRLQWILLHHPFLKSSWSAESHMGICFIKEISWVSSFVVLLSVSFGSNIFNDHTSDTDVYKRQGCIHVYRYACLQFLCLAQNSLPVKRSRFYLSLIHI